MPAPRASEDLRRRKHLLRSRIAARRAATARAAAPLLAALRWADLALRIWRRVPAAAKIAGVPALVSLAAWGLARGRNSRLRRWLPVLVAAVRGWRAARRRRSAARWRGVAPRAAARDAHSFARNAEHARK